MGCCAASSFEKKKKRDPVAVASASLASMALVSVTLAPGP